MRDGTHKEIVYNPESGRFEAWEHFEDDGSECLGTSLTHEGAEELFCDCAGGGQ